MDCELFTWDAKVTIIKVKVNSGLSCFPCRSCTHLKSWHVIIPKQFGDFDDTYPNPNTGFNLIQLLTPRKSFKKRRRKTLHEKHKNWNDRSRSKGVSQNSLTYVLTTSLDVKTWAQARTHSKYKCQAQQRVRSKAINNEKVLEYLMNPTLRWWCCRQYHQGMNKSNSDR